ncbi:TPA: HNH endonuclease [Bacillus cereus]
MNLGVKHSLCNVGECKKKQYCKGMCKAHYNKFYLYGDPHYNGRIHRRKHIEFDVKGNGCFECTSHTLNSGGYAEYWFNRKKYVMTRYIYQECFGDIPDELMVRHKCDNPKCINPEHLELGTSQDNVDDMVNRGRQAKGETSGTSILSNSDVKQIKYMLSRKYSCAEISRMYGVSRTCINSIKLNKTWRHIK